MFLRLKLFTISNVKQRLNGRFFNQLFSDVIVTFFVTVRLPKTVVKDAILYECDSGINVTLGFMMSKRGSWST